MGSILTFRSVNYPALGLSGGTPEVDLGIPLLPFIVRPALNGQGRGVSLESLTKPGWFVRQQNYRIRLDANDTSDLYKNDASWVPTYPLAGTVGGVSFQSATLPAYFMRHRNAQFWIDQREASTLYQDDATLIPTGPLYHLCWLLWVCRGLPSGWAYSYLTPGLSSEGSVAETTLATSFYRLSMHGPWTLIPSSAPWALVMNSSPWSCMRYWSSPTQRHRSTLLGVLLAGTLATAPSPPYFLLGPPSGGGMGSPPATLYRG